MRIITLISGVMKNHFNRKYALILLSLFLVMAGAGVASDAIAGDTTGELDITASQALTVIGGSVTGAEGGRVIVDEDGFAFKAPSQVYTGDRFSIELALGNRSNKPLELQTTIEAPPGFRVDVKTSDGASGAIRTGTDTWLLTICAGEADMEPDLSINISVSGAIQPGFYSLGCVIEPLRISGGKL